MRIKPQYRKTVIYICATVAMLAIFVIGMVYYHNHYVTAGGVICPRGAKTLDIRDENITPGEFEEIRAALPDCDILWSVPFQAGVCDSNSETVTLPVLTDGDIDLLQYMTNLTSVNATGCRDFPQLLKLQQQYPALEVSYNMTVNGTVYSRNSTTLAFDTVDPAELEAMLPHFPELTTVILSGKQPDDDALFALMEKFPNVGISWNLEICGVSVNSLAAEVDISGVRVEDLAALEASVLRLPNLKKVIMCGCGISNEDMDALNRRHEDVKFVWSVTIRGVSLRTDLTHLMPYQYNLWPTTREAQDFKYLTDLECLDLGHHKITNCDFVAYMPNLKYLLLGDTRITDLTPLEGLTDLIYLEIFLTGVTDYTPLLKLTKLQDLNLCYTRGQVEVIAQMTWVKYIRWITTEEKMLYKSEREFLTASLPNTVLELGFQQSSTGGRWRETQNYFDMRDILGMNYMTG